MTNQLTPSPSVPPFAPTRSALPPATAGARHPAIVLIASIAAGFAAATIPTWFVFQAVYTAAYDRCSWGKFCGLGAAVEGAMFALPVGYLVYGAVGVLLIFRMRGRGRRWSLTLVHFLGPPAVVGLLLVAAA